MSPRSGFTLGTRMFSSLHLVIGCLWLDPRLEDMCDVRILGIKATQAIRFSFCIEYDVFFVPVTFQPRCRMQLEI